MARPVRVNKADSARITAIVRSRTALSADVIDSPAGARST